MALVIVKILCLLNIMWTVWSNLIKFLICIDLNQILISQLYNTVMAIGYCHIFISTQYLGNRLMELDQVLHMHWCWPDLGLDSYASILTNFQHSSGPSLLSNFFLAQYFACKGNYLSCKTCSYNVFLCRGYLISTAYWHFLLWAAKTWTSLHSCIVWEPLFTYTVQGFCWWYKKRSWPYCTVALVVLKCCCLLQP